MMESKCIDGMSVSVQFGDLSRDDLDLAMKVNHVGWDIETSGLDWRNCKIGTCQLSIAEEKVVVIQMREGIPKHLSRLLTNENVCKVFHHATFDLRFMAYRWKIHPANIACTKIASKLLDLNKSDHSLKSLLWNHLGIEINKGQRLSNWIEGKMTKEQLSYAVRDAMYLIPLLRRLEEHLVNKGQLDLTKACWAHIPTRIQLDIGGYGDVYEY